MTSLVNITFVTWKIVCVSYEFFHTAFKYVIRTAISPDVFCVTEFFLNAILKNLFFCHATNTGVLISP